MRIWPYTLHPMWPGWAGQRDLSNHSTVEVLEEQMSGFYSVFSVLRYPVKLNEKYVCQITETDVNNQPFRIIGKYLSKSVKAGCMSHKGVITHQYLLHTKCIRHPGHVGDLKKHQEHKLAAYGKGRLWGRLSSGLKRPYLRSWPLSPQTHEALTVQEASVPLQLHDVTGWMVIAALCQSASYHMPRTLHMSF